MDEGTSSGTTVATLTCQDLDATADLNQIVTLSFQGETDRSLFAFSQTTCTLTSSATCSIDVDLAKVGSLLAVLRIESNIKSSHLLKWSVRLAFYFGLGNYHINRSDHKIHKPIRYKTCATILGKQTLTGKENNQKVRTFIFPGRIWLCMIVISTLF